MEVNDKKFVRYINFFYGNYLNTHQSTLCYKFIIWNEPINKSSYKNLMVPLSTLESKYLGEWNVTKKGIFYFKNLTNIDFNTLTVYFSADNKVAPELVNNHINLSQTKHIDIFYYQIQVFIKSNLLLINNFQVQILSQTNQQNRWTWLYLENLLKFWGCPFCFFNRWGCFFYYLAIIYIVWKSTTFYTLFSPTDRLWNWDIKLTFCNNKGK